MSEVKVTMRDFRACHMCGPGTLKFFHGHRELRRELIREGGIPVSRLEAIDDAMLAQVVAYAKGKNGIHAEALEQTGDAVALRVVSAARSEV